MVVIIHTSWGCDEDCCNTEMGILLFLKVRVLLHLYKRPTVVPVFPSWKRSEKNFHFYRKRWKVKIAFSICFATSGYRGSPHPKRSKWLHQPPPGTMLSDSASSRQSFEPCLWASGLCLRLLCASVSKMRPQVSEKLRELTRVLTLRVKLDVIKHICYDSVGYFEGLGTIKNFSI